MNKNTIGVPQTGMALEQEKNTELPQSLTYALNKENNKDYGKIEKEQIIDIEKIENTPFNIVTINTEQGQRSFISIGNNRVTKLYNGTVELWEKTTGFDWELITSLITIVTEKVVEAIKLEEKARNELKIGITEEGDTKHINR